MDPTPVVQSTPPVLPKGWVARESRSKPGRFVYYNSETKRCQWQRPKPQAIRFDRSVRSCRQFVR
jgi:hypothetical protein